MSEQIVYRDFPDAAPDGWGEMRLFVNGRDVTYFRGVWSQIGTYQAEDPFGPGPADFRFPQVSMLEAYPLGDPDLGLDGDLAWCNHDADAELWHVRDGVMVRRLWAGFFNACDVSSEGVTWHCAGELQGALECIYKPGEVFPFVKDGGRLAAAIVRLTGVRHTPEEGVVTGIEINERSRTAGTGLECVEFLLNDSQTDDGDQLTYLPNEAGKYVQQWRDRTTVHGTVFVDAHGVDLDLSSEPMDNTHYAQGRNPDGGLWCNANAQNLVQGPIPPYPGAIDLTGDDDTARAIRMRLRATGYMDEGDDPTDAVTALQRDAGIKPHNGVLSERTWNALYNVGVTGSSLRWASVLPLVQDERVPRSLYTSTGAIYGANPDYTGKRERGRFWDMGNMRKKRARAWLERELERDQTMPDWSGTITLAVDIAEGGAHFGDEITPLSRLDITPGMNLRLRNFGDLKVHVSGVEVSVPEDSSQPIAVKLAVDSKARNMLELSEILKRNRESRNHPARQWRRHRRGTHGNEQATEWSAEIGGLLGTDVPLQGDRWSHAIEIPAGQSGTLAEIFAQVKPAREFAVVLWTRRRSAADCRRIIGNPLADGNKWWKRQVVDEEKRKGALLEAWGTGKQPCGYSPGQKRDEDGPTGDNLTGKFRETSGIVYYTSRDDLPDGRVESGVLYMNVYAAGDCTLQSGQLLKINLDPGMG